MIPISICVIAKNEEKHMENFLSAIQKHFEGYPYEIILVDTGSSDSTLEIAQKYPVHVFHFTWVNDFSKARNYSISCATNDWILVLDCDEYISRLDYPQLQALIEQSPSSVGKLTIHEHFKMKGLESREVDYIPRLFNRTLFHFESSIHEQVVPLRPEQEYSYYNLPLTVEHYGYDGTEEELAKKSERNRTLLLEALKKEPDNAYLYFQLGREYRSIKEPSKARECFVKAISLNFDYQSEYALALIQQYGLCLLDLKEYKEALNFKNIYNLFSYSAEFVFLMGNIYLANGMLLEALTEFFKATTFETTSAEGINTYLAYYNMGHINELLGETETAIKLFKKCGNFSPALERLRKLGK